MQDFVESDIRDFIRRKLGRNAHQSAFGLVIFLVQAFQKTCIALEMPEQLYVGILVERALRVRNGVNPFYLAEIQLFDQRERFDDRRFQTGSENIENDQPIETLQGFLR